MQKLNFWKIKDFSSVFNNPNSERGFVRGKINEKNNEGGYDRGSENYFIDVEHKRQYAALRDAQY